MRILKLLILLFIITVLNGCTLGYFIEKNQKVTILKDSLTTMKINDEEPRMNYYKYVLPRDGMAHQVKISRIGYKDVYKIIYPSNFTSEGTNTVIINGLSSGLIVAALLYNDGFDTDGTMFISGAAASLGALWGTLLVYFNSKFWSYDNEIDFRGNLLPSPQRNSSMKEIKMNKVAVDINKYNSESYNVSYKNYLKENFNRKLNIQTESSIKEENTFIVDELNETLEKNGFIDTTGLVLNSNFNQNAYLNATIIGNKLIYVLNVNAQNSDDNFKGFLNIRLKVKWEFMDYYKNVIFTDTIESKSGEFVCNLMSKESIAEKNALVDAMESGLYELMKTESFIKASAIRKTGNTNTLDTLEIIKATKYVNSLEEAVGSTVTIKADKSHGSGFFISEDGYILTNYHVISDSAKLEVVTIDGNYYPVKIVRVNKEYDLALLKIDVKQIVPFKIPESSIAKMGKEIYVIGTPSAQDLSQTLTKGIISSIRTQSNGSKIIQTDASISFGNSGGPVIDKEGVLIGIVNSKLIGKGIEGIAFAIPADEISKFLNLKFK